MRTSSLPPFCSLVFAAALAGPAHAAQPGGVFVAEDDDTVVLSDRGWLPGARVVVSAPRTDDARPAGTPRPFEALVAEAARRHELQPSLLHAVIHVESRHAPAAVSPKGAMGLMQLMPATARALGVTRPFDPAQNIDGGAQYLRHLLDTFGGDTRLALAAYNAGAAAVQRHSRQVPPYPETQAYVPRVLARMAQLDASALLSSQHPSQHSSESPP